MCAEDGVTSGAALKKGMRKGGREREPTHRALLESTDGACPRLSSGWKSVNELNRWAVRSFDEGGGNCTIKQHNTTHKFLEGKTPCGVRGLNPSIVKYAVAGEPWSVPVGAKAAVAGGCGKLRVTLRQRGGGGRRRFFVASIGECTFDAGI